MKLFCVILSVSLFLAANASMEEHGDDFEGDIILTADQRRLIESGKDLASEDSMQRGASKFKRWPSGVVPYTIDSTLSGESRAKSAIASAMKEWSQKTCITFKLRTNEPGYINFRKGSGCSSNVGRTGRQQSINLAGGCWYHGIVVHEIGHALGFWHEQSRPDRDTYVTIMWDNIKEANKHNFNKYGDSAIDSLNVPYDYGSIMHYSARSFTKNGRNTIEPKNGAKIGQRTGLSALDVKQMNLMYKCGSGGGGNGGTPAPTPAPTQSPCKDISSSCSRYTSYCTSNSWVKKNCQKTCNLCGVACIDTWSKCAQYAAKYCKTNNYMKKHCKKTCKYC